ncbi:MAG TPA: SIR2 family protein [Acidobacteriaceae bacterium]|nr:SIR2 family protein [Acidobacteriaceae bacterium]
MSTAAIEAIAQSLRAGKAIPYLGPGVLPQKENALPTSAEALVARLTQKSSVPHKIRNNLGAAAQFIENFKHRSTVTASMTEAFTSDVQPTALHTMLMSLPALPLVVHAWYDDLPQKALRSCCAWGMAQGVSQAEHFGNWIHYYHLDGTQAENETAEALADWKTLLYQPLGSVWPARNYLVSDSDFVEVITEIDIQTPIPTRVQEIRSSRSFLFLGCRFSRQQDRLFARQIIKRSSQTHWAILPQEPTRNEERFLSEHGIERIPMPLDAFVAELRSAQLLD